MFRTLLRSLVAVTILMGAGLHAARHEPQSPQVSMPGYPAAGSPATVTLAAAGALPRAPLRFKLAVGQKDTLVMTMAMGLTMNMEGMAMPAMEMPLMKMWVDTAVTGIAPNGDITYDIAFTKMTAEAGAGGDPNLAAMIQGAAAEITSLKGSLTMSNRGINKSAALNLDKITDPSMKQTLGAMSSSFESLSMPLPEEPVGVGARWEVRQAIDSAGAKIFQRIECELVSLDADGATVKVKVEQTAPPQSVTNPAMPGMLMNIEKVTGGGAGTTTIKFNSLAPVSDLASSTMMNMSVDIGGQTQKMAVQTNLKVSVAPEKK